nr:hypothetical protein CJLB15_00067 [Campylobacter phage CJLB-15]
MKPSRNIVLIFYYIMCLSIMGLFQNRLSLTGMMVLLVLLKGSNYLCDKIHINHLVFGRTVNNKNPFLIFPCMLKNCKTIVQKYIYNNLNHYFNFIS